MKLFGKLDSFVIAVIAIISFFFVRVNIKNRTNKKTQQEKKCRYTRPDRRSARQGAARQETAHQGASL